MNSRPTVHVVQFFDSDPALIDAACRYIQEGIEMDETCIALTTGARLEAIATRLAAFGLNAEALLSAYRYVAVDAHMALQRFLGGEGPDQQRFHRHMGTLIRQAGARGKPVRIFGQMASLLFESGRARCALRLEEMWNEVSRFHTFKLMCAYSPGALPHDSPLRRRVCTIHGCALDEARPATVVD